MLNEGRQRKNIERKIGSKRSKYREKRIYEIITNEKPGVRKRILVR